MQYTCMAYKKLEDTKVFLVRLVLLNVFVFCVFFLYLVHNVAGVFGLSILDRVVT